MLTTSMKKKTRQIARSAWIRSGGDIHEAEKIAREEIKLKFGFVTWLLLLNAIVSLCYTLFRFWHDLNMLVPPQEPMEGEPG